MGKKNKLFLIFLFYLRIIFLLLILLCSKNFPGKLLTEEKDLREN